MSEVERLRQERDAAEVAYQRFLANSPEQAIAKIGRDVDAKSAKLAAAEQARATHTAVELRHDWAPTIAVFDEQHAVTRARFLAAADAITAYLDAIDAHNALVSDEGSALTEGGMPLEDTGGTYNVGGSAEVVLFDDGRVERRVPRAIMSALVQRLAGLVVGARLDPLAGRRLQGFTASLEALYPAFITTVGNDELPELFPIPAPATREDTTGATMGDQSAITDEMRASQARFGKPLDVFDWIDRDKIKRVRPAE